MPFNYSNSSRKSAHNMVPLMGNMTNGDNFLPQLPTLKGSHPLSSSGTSNKPNDIQQSDYNNQLEFSNSAFRTRSYNNNDRNYVTQALGAGPMDLENDNDSLLPLDIVSSNIRRYLSSNASSSPSVGTHNTDLINKDQMHNALSEDQIDSIKACMPSSIKTNVATSSAVLTPGEMFLSNMLGMGHNAQNAQNLAQSFMMMPGMMMDQGSIPLQMHQLPLFQTAAMPQPTAASIVGSVTNPGELSYQKEIITCKSCTLFPPNPNAPPPTIRDRPQGCRTVFVGGLPETITEEIIREIFESCGEITTLRLSKKNFCHIRFVYEVSVDSAIYLSGYRMRIGSSNDPANCGRLHVDYAQARDDQYEWECKQRQLQREQRHREQMERDRLRSVSPPPVPHYTEHEASSVAEKLKSDETFLKAVHTLIVWLERGDCSKKNANTFYSMIQSTNAHVRRLNNDKQQFEEEIKRARALYRNQISNIMQQFTQIEKVFIGASHKKVWDHFTKAQRKNIDHWKKLSAESRTFHTDEDEMEMSDEDRNPSKRSRLESDNLKEENDSLRCQLEAYKNEITLVKTDIKTDSEYREKQIKTLEETVRNLQTQSLEDKAKEKEFLKKISDLEEKLKEANVKQLLLKTRIMEVKANNSAIAINASKNLETSENTEKQFSRVSAKTQTDIDIDSFHDTDEIIIDKAKQPISTKFFNTQIKKEKIDDANEARIIALVSTYLVVHPFGTSPDYICSYIQNVTKLPNLTKKSVEEILHKYDNIFTEEITENGSKVNRKWKFCGFDNANNLTKKED